MSIPPPSLAIVCCGLGRIRRGNETWALKLGQALTRAGSPVRVVGGAAIRAPGVDYAVAPCLSRQGAVLRFLPVPARYVWEQRTFVWSVRRLFSRRWPRLIHAADPQVAWWLKLAGEPHGCRVIYKDGLRLGADWNWRFEAVQVLAPYYRESAAAAGVDVERWHVVPHFVDTEAFSPGVERDQEALRRRILGGKIPGGARVVLAVGDLAPGSGKRIDWIVSELARLPEAERPWLVVAGHATPGAVRAFEGRSLGRLGGRLCLCPNVTLESMPDLYRSADLLVHAALSEPFGFVLIEAMACGVPVVAHRWPVSAWIVGDGGGVTDMEEPGALADAVSRWMADPEGLASAGLRARRRIEEQFSPAVVLPQYQRLHATVMAGRRP